jgi:hypothetical protein
MKTTVAVLLMAVLSVGAAAQTTPANPQAPATPATPAAPKSSAPVRVQLGGTTAPATKAPAAGTKAAAPAAKASTAKAAGVKAADQGKAKKEEAPPKIEGMEIARSSKGFLGLQVADGNFKLSFYNAEKKVAAPDVVRAVLRWTPSYKPGNEVYVLGPGDGKSLTVAKTVRPPYHFKLFISLFVEGNDNPVESYVVDFRQ